MALFIHTLLAVRIRGGKEWHSCDPGASVNKVLFGIVAVRGQYDPPRAFGWLGLSVVLFQAWLPQYTSG